MTSRSRSQTRSQTRSSRTQKRSRKNDDVLEGLNLNRTGEYVRVDDELIKRLGGSDIHENPKPQVFQDYPRFLEIAKSDKALTLEQLQEYDDELQDDPISAKMAEMIGNIPIDWLAMKRSKMSTNDWEYNVKLPVKARVADQMHSGRCWEFAGLSQLRLNLIQKFNLDHRFELSPAYLFFYDKLERANVFLETAWQFRDHGVNSRDWLSLISPGNHMLNDGGYYNYFYSLINKYGIVPKNMYDECYNSSCTDGMNRILVELLNDMALQLNNSDLTLEDFQHQKRNWMSTIYQIVVKFLGKPPTPDTKFTWTYRDAEDHSHSVPGMNPIKFYQTVVDGHLDTKVLIINDPRHPETYAMSSFFPYSLNVSDGTPASMINLSIQDFKSAVCESLKAEEAVWFACDIGHAFMYENNTADPDMFDYQGVLGVDCNFSKSDMLNSRTSVPNHAMLFIGVDTEEDRDGNVLSYKKWRVENSWGMMNLLEDDPDSGYCRFSDSYMDKYVTEAVVDIKYLPPHILEKIMENTKAGRTYTYEPYDVFGAVAKYAPCQHCKSVPRKFQNKMK